MPHRASGREDHTFAEASKQLELLQEFAKQGVAIGEILYCGYRDSHP